MFAGARTKTKCAALQAFGTESQQLVGSLIYDDDVQVIATFDMNRVASLTYGDGPRDEIFEMLRETVAKPVDYTVPSLQKTLILLKHLVTHGSERTVNEAWALGTYVDKLREYNTVLLSQRDPDAPAAFWHRFKGGDVDRGTPVREAAEDLHTLLGSTERIRTVRARSADPSSLVPVGTDRDVAYASDEVRLRMLKADMARQTGKATKSNLKKAEGGFGSGYNSTKGGSIVGAAHGIDEMLAMAKREKKKFSDDPVPGDAHDYIPRREELEELERSLQAAHGLKQQGGEQHGAGGGSRTCWASSTRR